MKQLIAKGYSPERAAKVAMKLHGMRAARARRIAREEGEKVYASGNY